MRCRPWYSEAEEVCISSAAKLSSITNLILNTVFLQNLFHTLCHVQAAMGAWELDEVQKVSNGLLFTIIPLAQPRYVDWHPSPMVGRCPAVKSKAVFAIIGLEKIQVSCTFVSFWFIPEAPLLVFVLLLYTVSWHLWKPAGERVHIGLVGLRAGAIYSSDPKRY